MPYILLGMTSFLIAILFDLVSLRRISYVKPAIGLIAGGLGGYSHLMICIRGEELPLPAGLSYVGWPLLSLASLSMLYSLFLEIPFQKTYVTDGTGGKLISTGTYALVRHPGVLWYALLLVSLILISRRGLALLAAPIWLLTDVLYVWMQEKFFFSQMFPGYEQYRRETPMLIPNRTSVARCLRTLAEGWKCFEGNNLRRRR